MYDLKAASQGSSEPDAGWLDLFSKRYWKGSFVFSVSDLTILIPQIAS
jgi:hypothetical protein